VERVLEGPEEKVVEEPFTEDVRPGMDSGALAGTPDFFGGMGSTSEAMAVEPLVVLPRLEELAAGKVELPAVRVVVAASGVLAVLAAELAPELVMAVEAREPVRGARVAQPCNRVKLPKARIWMAATVRTMIGVRIRSVGRGDDFMEGRMV
jgi:hypothetical protein